MNDAPGRRTPHRGLDASAKVLIALVAFIPIMGIWHALIKWGVLPKELGELGSTASPAGFLLAGIFVVGLFLSFYFLPTIIAKVKKRRNIVAIAVVNLFFGWTILGWFVALIWALVEPATPQQTIIYMQEPPARPSPDEQR